MSATPSGGTKSASTGTSRAVPSRRAISRPASSAPPPPSGGTGKTWRTSSSLKASPNARRTRPDVETNDALMSPDELLAELKDLPEPDSAGGEGALAGKIGGDACGG